MQCMWNFDYRCSDISKYEVISDQFNTYRMCIDVYLHLHNSHFTDPLFKLSWTEYEIGQYSIIQYENSIAQYYLITVQ